MRLCYLFFILIIFSCTTVVFSLWEGCDYYQEVKLGEVYTISSPNYPEFYGKNPLSCRWTAKAPVGYIVAFSCYVEIPQGVNCNRDRLLLSRTGDRYLTESEVHCGKKWFEVDTFDESGVIGLYVPYTTVGGRFQCNLSAVKKDCACGARNTQRKNTPFIIGGTPVQVNEFPSFAALVDLDVSKVYCGGTIITNQYVVTAAHCLLNKIASRVGVLVGDHDYNTASDTKYSALYRANSFIRHEKYSTATKQNDIALVKTVDTMQFNYGVSPACLPFRYQWTDITGKQTDFVGYGTTEFSGPMSTVPLRASIQVISNTECSQKITDIINDQVCGFASGRDACQGDSGGPMFYTDPKGIVYNVGIISYGKNCGEAFPSVNTRITSYLSWILAKTGNNYCYM